MPWYERPFVWWRRHAWLPVWIAVVLTPVALLSLRLIDDTAVAVLVQPTLIVMIALFLLTLVVAVRASVPRSLPRALTGGGGALLAATLLALPMVQVIGQRPCPERMGADRGAEVTLEMLGAWRKGEPAPADVWASSAAADAWRARLGTLTLIGYRMVDSGCWERLAPVTTRQTWHEFRLTVQQGDDRFSKVVTVHTRATRSGWRIAEIEGPES